MLSTLILASLVYSGVIGQAASIIDHHFEASRVTATSGLPDIVSLRDQAWR